MRGGKDFKVWVESVSDQHGDRDIRVAETTLPSGLRVKFRVPGPYGWLSIWRAIPSISVDDSSPSKKLDENKIETSMIDKALRTLIEFSMSPKIVNKPPSEISGEEFSAWLIDDGDVAEFLEDVAAAMGFNGNQAKAASEIVS